MGKLRRLKQWFIYIVVPRYNSINYFLKNWDSLKSLDFFGLKLKFAIPLLCLYFSIYLILFFQILN